MDVRRRFVGRRLAALVTVAMVTALTIQAGTVRPVVAAVDSCGYTDTTFNESYILYATQLIGTGADAHVGLFFSDEWGILLGVNGATLNTANPQHVADPDLGDITALLDPSGRIYAPMIYITDITLNPTNRSGDWQMGGAPHVHVDDIYGVWATSTFDGTNFVRKLPFGKNNGNLGPGADPMPPGSPDEGYDAEVRWDLTSLTDQLGNPLAPGHTYRLQVMAHDGDQNKAGGDAGEMCVNVTIPPDQLVAKKIVDKSTADPGATLNYTITVHNPNPLAETVDVTDDISPVVPTYGTLTGSNPVATVTGGNHLSWPSQTIPGNGTVTYTYSVKLMDAGWPPGTTTLPDVVVVTKSNCIAGSTDPDCRTTTTVTPTPHLTVTKTPDAQTVVAGNPVGFTITVTSDGLGPAYGVTLTDALPTLANANINWGISPAYAGPGTCGINGIPPSETLNCAFGDMAVGASVSVHVTSNTTAPPVGQSLATCKITVETYDTNLDNTVSVISTNGASATADTGTCVTGTPHVTVTKTPNAPSVVAGNPVGFTITVTSDGVGTANNVTLVDSLPTLANAGVNWAISPPYTDQGTCGINGAPPTETLNCALGNMASGTSVSIHLLSPTTAPPAGQSLAACQKTVETYATNLDNTVNISSANAGSATAQAGTCVGGNPHVTVVKTPDATSVLAGNPIGFTISVTSDGIGTANAVTLTDSLPTLANANINWSIDPAYVGLGACGINGSPPTETLNCVFGDIPSGTSVSVHVTSATTAPTGGASLAACVKTSETYDTNLDNQVDITSSNAGSATAHTGVCLHANPHVSVTKTPDAQTVVAGSSVGFTITVTSDGVGTANAVTLSDPLPTLANAGISWSISPAYTGPGTCSITGAAPSQTLACSFGDMASGASASIHVTSPTTAPAPQVQLAACQVTVETYGTNLDNQVDISSANAGTATADTGICVVGQPHVSVIKTPDAQTVVAGSPIGFTITVMSDGVGTANAVTLTDPLPTLADVGINWSISPAYTGQGSCGINGSPPNETLNCAFGDMTTGTAVSVHVTSATTSPTTNTPIAACQVTIETYATNLDNLVDISSANAGSASAQTGICLTGQPHVTVVKTPDATTVLVGNPIGFTITVTSDGVGTANNVALSDPLPTLANANLNWSISPAYAGQGSCGINGGPPAETLNCAFGNMPSGTILSVHVTSNTTAPTGGNTIAACQVTTETYATNVDNQANITSANAGSAIARTGICVDSNPHVTVVKTADAPTVVAGNSVGFTITVTSDGVGTATNVVLADPLPTLANVGISWSISPVYGGPGTCAITGAAPSQSLDCQFGNLAQGAVASVHVTSATTAPAPGVTIAPCLKTVETYETNIDNTVTITSSNAASSIARTGTCVVNVPHVRVVKTPDTQTVVAGNPVGFTITVISDGVGTANSVTLSDALPTLANVGINWFIDPAYAGQGTCGINGSPPSETLSCAFGNMASGTSLSVHVTSATTAPASNSLIATCQVTTETYETNIDNTVSITSANAGSATAQTGICVKGRPHITVTKLPDAQTVVAGNPVGFTITVASDGVGTATGVSLNDPLPTLANAGISWSISPAYTGQGTCSITGAAPSQSLSCAIGNLASGDSILVHVTSPTTAPTGAATIAPCVKTVTTFETNLDNTVTVTSTNATGAAAQTGTCVKRPPHVTVTKTPDATTVVAGNPVGFTITVTNDGVGTATGVAVSDPLPTLANAGISWSISPAYGGPGTCGITGAVPTQTLGCAIGDLAQGASASVHVTSATIAPPVGLSLAACVKTTQTYDTNLDNQVSVTSTNAGSAIATTGICVTGNPHISVVKTPDAPTVEAGNPLGFTITVTSDGVGTVTNVTLSDPLPTLAGLGISWSISPAYAGPGTCGINGAVPSQTLACSFGDLAAGTTVTIHLASGTSAPPGGSTIAPCVKSSTTYETNLDNTVTITSANAGSSIAMTGICIPQRPHLVATKIPDAQTVAAGNPVGFTITMKNDGTGTATGVTLTDPLPTLAGIGINWTISPAYAGQGTCTINGTPPAQTLACTLGDMLPGASASVHVTSPTTAPGAGVTIAPCEKTTTTWDTNLNNSVQVTSQNAASSIARTGTCVTTTPHVTVFKTPDSTSVLAGNPVGFTITVRSDGNGTATTVTLTDPLPTLAGAGISWSISPAYAGPGSCTITGVAPSQTLTCSFGDMPSGTQATVHVTSPTTAPAGGATLATCQKTTTTWETNLNNAVQVTSLSGGSSTAITGTCITTNPQPGIRIVKVARPTLLPVGGGQVTYSYAVTNTGNVALANVTVTDDKCSPVVFLSGDANGDAKLDLTETWSYSCTTTITVTTTNTATVVGHYDGQTVTDQDQATVVVPVPTPSPSGSVKGATSPPKPHVTLPPTEPVSDSPGTGGTSTYVVLSILAGVMAAVPVLVFGRRRRYEHVS